MSIQPKCFAFTLLLGLLAAVPYSGIDINLPALSATGATLGVTASEVGLTGVLAIGLKLMTSGAVALLATTLAGWSSPALVAALLIVVALAFGLSIPNVMNATLAPLPDIAGAVSAIATSIQLTAGAASSGLVSVLFDGRSALSMAAIMALCSLVGLAAYLLLARRAELSRRAVSLQSGH